jgi:hypothetical protein
MAEIPLIAQTTYAELLERCASVAFGAAFAGNGNFVAKTKKGRQGLRRYWYFQEQTGEGRRQRYVGPETPELLERIATHRSIRHDEDGQRKLVSALVRTFGMPQPMDEIGRIIAALADAGAFRLRAVLIGTCAYQVYAPMLGVRLPSSVLMTEDIDIAQFQNVSVAVEDAVPPVLETLRLLDNTFVPVPHSTDSRRSTRYRNGRGIRVEFLTPNEGAETDEPQLLPAQSTEAQPLRHLDFLIHDCVPAVVLHGSGILVLVPTPERYAIHKLIVARRRQRIEKARKDLMQAQALISVVAGIRPHELRAVWDEAFRRGKKWRRYLFESLVGMTPEPRDLLLKTVQMTRGKVPGLTLSFDRTAPRYDFDRDIFVFPASDAGGPIKCAITLEALEDHFDVADMPLKERIRRFHENRKLRALIERMVEVKYLARTVDTPGEVMIKSGDVETLRAEAAV